MNEDFNMSEEMVNAMVDRYDADAEFNANLNDEWD